jgi:hypothetical protein
MVVQSVPIIIDTSYNVGGGPQSGEEVTRELTAFLGPPVFQKDPGLFSFILFSGA